MGEPTWTGHVSLRRDGYGVYTGALNHASKQDTTEKAFLGDWLEYSDHFSAFYSHSTKLLSGGWFSEGNLFWGGINFHWDGIRFTGHWSWYPRNGTGYEEWFPVGADYIVPPLPPQPPPEEEYHGDLP